MPLEKVEVVVLMHGRASASSMLETAQELLETTSGYAMNMSLDTEVGAMYEKLLAYVSKNKDKLSNGLLLLTDMGSLNSFATLIYEETGIRTKAISMSSTMIVLEALRMAESGRSLEDIYQNIQRSFETIVQEQFRTVREAKGNKGSNRYVLYGRRCRCQAVSAHLSGRRSREGRNYSNAIY